MGSLDGYRVTAPTPVTLSGRFVTLEPYDEARHLSALWEALGGASHINALLVYFPVGDFADPRSFGDWLESGRVRSGLVTLVFRDHADDAVVGMASYMRADPGNGVVEVGSVAHGEAMRRSPLATEAHYLMARHVFETLGYRRYEWKCHDGNAASKAAALRLGFRFEGVFRQHMISRGENRDTAWFSMIDAEWPLLKAAFEAWLAPENFDAEGRQRRRLEELRGEFSGEAGR